jgi:FtsH-binding integral membrane protein
MSDFHGGSQRFGAQVRPDMAVDAGLRSFMLGVYNKMALGLLVSAALAFLTSAYAPARDLFYVVQDGHLVGFTLLGTVIRFAPIVVLLGAMFMSRGMTPAGSTVVYWAVVSSIGAGLGVWLLAYTQTSVFTAFLVTAIAFGGLSLVGYTTKRDLTGFGSFLIMGLIGIIVASVVNMFLHLGSLAFVINILGVLIFAGLTAYDTQKLKLQYYALGGDRAAMSVATNYGALNLYLDFINIFQFLLSIFGSRR